MATWYAVNSSANINAANQWNSAADGSGSMLTWASLGATDILYANGKTNITINVNVTCAKISTGTDGIGTTGGTFINPAAGVVITAAVEGGSTVCITTSGSNNAFSVIGAVTAGGAANAHGITHSTQATITVQGAVTGGAGSGVGIRNAASSSTINITGEVTGGAGGSGVTNVSSGSINITGNVTGGSGTTVYGLYNVSTGACSIVGTLQGGTGDRTYGLFSGSTGVTTITGIILNTAGRALALGGYASVYYTPTASQYIRVPSGVGTTADYPQGLAAGNIKSGVVSGTVTGTYTGGGSCPIGSNIIVGGDC